MQEGVSAEALVAKLAAEASQEGLRDLLDMAKVHHGALPVASFSPLLQSLTSCLLNPETALLSAQLILELIPDSDSELESHFPPLLSTLFDRLGTDQSDLADTVTSTIQRYAEYTKNLEQVFTAAMQAGLRCTKVRDSQWQGRLRTLMLVEPLLRVDAAFVQNLKNVQRLVETLILMVRDTSVRVQNQAKAVVRSLTDVIPEFDKVVNSLTPSTVNIYENEIAVAAPRLTQEIKLLRSSLQSQPQPNPEEASTGYAYQTAATDRVKSTVYESQLAPNGLEFGFIPPHVLTQLREAENWRSRANAVQELESLVCTASDDLDSITPFFGAFFRFLRELLGDTNLKVTQSTLSIVTTLLTLPGLSKRANVAQLIPSCLEKLGDNKIAVRQAAFKVFRGFISELPPRLLFPHLLSALGSPNWHIREAVLHVMMAAMLCDNPDYDYDFCALILPVSGMMDDQKPKVAFTAAETLAVIAHVKGRGTVLEALYGQIDESRLDRLRRRFEQGSLPSLKDDYIEFPKTQPTSAPLISSTQPVYSPEDTRRSASPIARQKDVNSSNSTEDTSLSPGFRFGAATEATPMKTEDGDLPALRQPYLPINMSTKGGGSGRRVNYGYQIRSSLTRRHPLLRFNLSKPSNETASDYFPSPAPTKRKAVDTVSASDNSLYAPLEQLDPVANPEVELQQCLVSSQSQEWSVQFEMLNTLRRLLRHHVSVFPFQGDLHTLILAVVKLADSLRSSLAKNSLIVIKEMAEGLGKGMDADLEVVCMLVTRKCGDTNVFISEEAEHALLAICQHCSENRVILSLLSQSTVTKVSIVKAKIGLGLQHVLRRCAQGSIRIKDLDRLFVVLAGYLSDASSDVRSGARSAFSVLRLTFHSETDFEKVLFRSLPDKTAKEVKSSIGDPKPLLRPLRSQSSRRTSSPFKSLRTQRKVPIESNEDQGVIAVCARGMGATEWKTRYEALDQLAEFVKANWEKLKKSPVIMTVVDLITQACGDKNLSVSLHALDSLRTAVPSLAGCLEPHLPILLRALSGAMAAGNSAIRDAAAEAARTLFQHCDFAYSASALSTAIPISSAKAKPVLTALVIGKSYSEMLPKLKPGIIRRHVLPLAYKLMDDPKPETRAECFKLLQTLYKEIGSLVVESAPSSKLQKVLDLINE